ncbi:helix-turn-helix domain-containing protein [Roseovarius salis]|uniref:helix-turn-helix domain-containing protein n=1 Tax=Roseovarius salis TaxID=3376063 RepID=UPI0037C7AE49
MQIFRSRANYADHGLAPTHPSRNDFLSFHDITASRPATILHNAALFSHTVQAKRDTRNRARQRYGGYRGGNTAVDDQKVKDLKQQGKRTSEIAAALGVSRMTVYRAIKG